MRLDAECIGFAAHPDGIAAASRARRAAGESSARTCCSPSAASRTPTISDSTRPASTRRARARSRSTTSCARTSTAIWALGDCNGRGAFTHTSYNDHEIVVANLFDDDPRRVSDRIPCYGLFIDPPLGRVGMTEAQARASGGTCWSARADEARRPGIEMSETAGFMKFLVDADTDELLGGAILGINGDEVIQSLLDVMYAEAPYTTISRAMHIHPTVAELVPTTLQRLRPLDG